MGQISTRLAEFLDLKKTEAQETGIPSLAELNGLKFHVGPSGGAGGYAFICNTGKAGEVWKLKRPTPSGKWGIFVSVSAVRASSNRHLKKAGCRLSRRYRENKPR